MADDPDEAAEPSPVVVATKFRRPSMRAGMLARDHLVQRLADGADARVTLVAGPAGYGKTSLLAAWAAERTNLRPVAWVNLDDGDNDVAVLWSHVIEALRAALPGLVTSADPATSGAAPLTRWVLPRLMNDLDGLEDCDLVLDDLHRVTSEASRETLAWVAGHMPTNLHLVLASRTEPRLPLAVFRARGELLELRLDDLRFSVDEATEFLNGSLELGLAPEDVLVLHTRTEGWPAGLYLGALSLRNAPDRHDFVHRFGASHRHVLDYLVDEVLTAHPPEVQDLMLRSSILDRLNGRVCDAVLERSGSAADLRDLSRTNLFLVALDDTDEWYRFHHLFGQLLFVELQRRFPDVVPDLHRRASSWYLAEGDHRMAIEHALSAGAWAEAAEIVERTWWEFANAGQYETVLTWIRRFPPEVSETDVRMLLVEAWVLSLCARREEAAGVLAAIDSRAPHATGMLPDGFASVESSVTTLRALLPWGDVGTQLIDARRACELEPIDSPWYPCGAWSVGAALYYKGELDEADEWFAESFTLAVTSAQWIVATSSLAYRSLIAGAARRTDDQRVLAHQAAELATSCGLEDVVGEAHSALGLWLGTQGEHALAQPLLARGVEVMRAWGQPTELARSLLSLATCLDALGETDQARAALSEARQIIDECVDPGALPGRLASIESGLASHRDAMAGLTPREREIIGLLDEHLSEREIADRLFISFNTVHTHVRRIYRKLGVTSRSDAVRHAQPQGDSARKSPR